MARISYHLVVTLVLLSHFSLYARETFNIHALELDSPVQGIDLSSFIRGEESVPGVYLVTVYINGKIQGDEQHIRFVNDKQGRLQPQITPAMLKRWGVHIDRFMSLSEKNNDLPVDSIERIIPMASVEFIFNQQKLNISIPQAATDNQDRNAIDSSRWDEGVTAGLLNYSVSGGQGWEHADSNSYYANLQSGVNLGAFRFRNYSTWKYNDKSGSAWQSINSFIQRDIAFLKSQLIFGDSYTTADIFDGVPFRGIQLASDDNMLSDSQRGFAPVIRGVAQSNAEVTVKQNGYTILQTYVAPGAFTLTNLYPVVSGGDLTITVREADGSEHTFAQPYSAVPLMQREGRLKYATTVGKYHHHADEPAFVQMTAMYGLPYGVTILGGTQYARDYHSQALGVGIGFGSLGAVSVDVTLAQAEEGTGSSYRLLYSKSVQTTGTNVMLAGYRYSTSNFYTFADAIDARTHNGCCDHRRQRLQLDISQPIGHVGSFFLSAYQQSYWHKKENELTLSGGWNSSFYGFSYNILYSQSQSREGSADKDRQLAINFQFPLKYFSTGSWANMSMTSASKGHMGIQGGINGTVLDNRNLSYSIQQNYSHEDGTSGNLSADYKGRYAEIGAGYSNSGNSRQFNYSLKGGIVIHPYGVTLSQPLSDQFAIVRTPGVNGVKLRDYPGVMTDSWGNAIAPYISPYRQNNITLDVESMDSDIDVTEAVKAVIPTQGAIVIANYNTHVGARILLSLLYKGRTVPFGAIVTASSGETGIVGSEGLVYLSGLQSEEHLTVAWNKTRSCVVTLKLSPSARTAVQHLSEVCR